MAITRGYKQNFETLLRAIANKAACLMECKDAKTGEPVIAVCALQREADGAFTMVPIAKMFDGNPYEELIPPMMDDADTMAVPA